MGTRVREGDWKAAEELCGDARECDVEDQTPQLEATARDGRSAKTQKRHVDKVCVGQQQLMRSGHAVIRCAILLRGRRAQVMGHVILLRGEWWEGEEEGAAHVDGLRVEMEVCQLHLQVVGEVGERETIGPRSSHCGARGGHTLARARVCAHSSQAEGVFPFLVFLLVVLLVVLALALLSAPTLQFLIVPSHTEQ